MTTDYDRAIQESLKTHQDYQTKENTLFQQAIEESLNHQLQQQINSFNTILTQPPISNNDKLFKMAYKKLNDYQKSIFYDCIKKRSAGLSLPLGAGKTFVSLTLSLYQTRETLEPILVVASKSLVASWEHEVKKFFGNTLKYEIIHKSIVKGNINLWKPHPDTRLIITTIDTLGNFYKQHNVHEVFIERKLVDRTITRTRRHYRRQGRNQPNNQPQPTGIPQHLARRFRTQTVINEYVKPTEPFLKHSCGGGYFFSITWGCFIVDEVQKYTNISTRFCQSLGAICSTHRWLLSGTMFDEPKVDRILGYYIILNDLSKPRNLPDMAQLLYSDAFQGLNQSLVKRDSNKAFIPPKVNEFIITHKLSPQEEKVYLTMKNILTNVRDKAKAAKLCKDSAELRKLTSYKIVMIMYLRQTLVCPLIPLTSIAIDSCDMEKNTELSQLIMEEVGTMGINQWLDNPQSVKSSRITHTLASVNKHPNEKVVIFSCFKSCLDIMEYYLNTINRPIFRMLASMNVRKRHQLIKDFEKTPNGILVLTYQLGAEGLNLQFASTIMLVDFWWNASKTQQAIGRIFRFGQKAKEINVYFFTANTGIEKILFEKQKAKLDILNELKTGRIKTKIPRVKIDDVIKMIEMADNKEKLKEIKYY